MIITRTPFRITLGGGGTDLPEYYEKRGGFILATAINKYMYVAVNKPKTDDLVHIKSRNTSETAEDVSTIKHELARITLSESGRINKIDVSSISDIDAGTGLGSSSCYVVGLLKATSNGGKEFMAEADYYLERKIGRHIGKQDPYMATYGGMKMLEIGTEGKVKVTTIVLKPEVRRKLNRNLMLFFTGVTRQSEPVLKEQADNISTNLDNFDKIKQIGLATAGAIMNGNLDDVGELFDEHWQYKKATAKCISNEKFDELYDFAKSNGALGGKISGAGGGGFFLFYVPKKHKDFTGKMKEKGLRHMEYKFEKGGSRVIYHD